MSDRINLFYWTDNDEAKQAFAENQNYITEQVLAVSFQFDDKTAKNIVEIEGSKILFGLDAVNG